MPEYKPSKKFHPRELMEFFPGMKPADLYRALNDPDHEDSKDILETVDVVSELKIAEKAVLDEIGDKINDPAVQAFLAQKERELEIADAEAQRINDLCDEAEAALEELNRINDKVASDFEAEMQAIDPTATLNEVEKVYLRTQLPTATEEFIETLDRRDRDEIVAKAQEIEQKLREANPSTDVDVQECMKRMSLILASRPLMYESLMRG